jgi:hypothetical protein
VLTDNPAGDAQSEPSATCRARAVGLVETFEDVLDRIRGDARATVCDTEFNPVVWNR